MTAGAAQVSNPPQPWLVGDVGATNARFGLVSPDGELLHSSSFAVTDFVTIGAAVSAYLAQRGSLPVQWHGSCSRNLIFRSSATCMR